MKLSKSINRQRKIIIKDEVKKEEEKIGLYSNSINNEKK